MKITSSNTIPIFSFQKLVYFCVFDSFVSTCIFTEQACKIIPILIDCCFHQESILDLRIYSRQIHSFDISISKLSFILVLFANISGSSRCVYFLIFFPVSWWSFWVSLEIGWKKFWLHFLWCWTHRANILNVSLLFYNE